MPAAPSRVRDVLVDLAGYPDWWPQVVAVASTVARPLLRWKHEGIMTARVEGLRPVLA